jgi:hypothetical protein
MTPTTDARVDAYIGRAAAFAQPILMEVRSPYTQRVHERSRRSSGDSRTSHITARSYAAWPHSKRIARSVYGSAMC